MEYVLTAFVWYMQSISIHASHEHQTLPCLVRKVCGLEHECNYDYHKWIATKYLCLSVLFIKQSSTGHVFLRRLIYVQITNLFFCISLQFPWWQFEFLSAWHYRILYWLHSYWSQFTKGNVLLYASRWFAHMTWAIGPHLPITTMQAKLEAWYWQKRIQWC